MELNEDRYEHLDMIIKSPAPDGEPWFDKIFDLITSFCNAEEDVCTCGLESMGGGGGTLDQCYDHARITDKWAIDVEAADLKWLLSKLEGIELINDEEFKSISRLREAAYWHDDFNERYSNLDDDDDEEFELDPEVAPYFSDEPLPPAVTTHLEHWQQCNCLADSAVCCRERCWCKDEV